MTALAPIDDRRRMTIDRRKGGGRRAEELDAALREGQVEILFQPQFSCGDGRLVGAEVLSRWNHPRLGRIGAEALLDIAERAGEASRLTRHIAQRALAIAATWPAPLCLSLNVSASDLAEEGFAATISSAVAEAGFSPERLTLEITEQALVRDLDAGAAQLERLAARGIRIALDDFGAGFCNFRYLKRLPLDALKLDRSMIEGIAEDQRDLAVLRGILAMARALDLSVTAEGIETEAQRETVAREGCAVWQGFLGAQPMAAEDFAQMARA
jgi:EAL domain-containing protein (putative c-di-GMP-specific phosphodiesterase class I)